MHKFIYLGPLHKLTPFSFRNKAKQMDDKQLAVAVFCALSALRTPLRIKKTGVNQVEESMLAELIHYIRRCFDIQSAFVFSSYVISYLLPFTARRRHLFAGG